MVRPKHPNRSIVRGMEAIDHLRQSSATLPVILPQHQDMMVHITPASRR
jgi:hypothetical protein